MIRIILKGEKPWSWNKHWSGVHWTKRKAERDRVHMLVRSEIDPNDPNAVPSELPVHIKISVWFKNKRDRYDSANICSKPYIDALIGWYIYDDNPDHVPVVTQASFIDKRRPRMEIEIEQIEEPPF